MTEAVAESTLVPRVETTDDLELLLGIVPERVRLAVLEEPLRELVEIVMDLGRPAEARYDSKARRLGDELVTREELALAVERAGDFSGDNRAGIEGTLHRISALRSRRGEIIGLTCRVGRAVTGTVEIVRDLLGGGASLLLLGKPGVGKTTLLREIARVCADELGKRTLVVDTSNEIAGDGDIPHPGIGGARRMQVPSPDRQHATMIEAVENHMPEVVIVDEIGTAAEATAARTIAERGVQLVATAHGTELANLVANPTLNDLVGGIESVTLGDDEARRRRSRKTVLERRSRPTFASLVEIQDRYRFAVHADVAAAVDALLTDRQPRPEIRTRESDGRIHVETPPPAPNQARDERRSAPTEGKGPRRIYPFGLSENRLTRAIQALRIRAVVAANPRSADLVIALRSAMEKDARKLEVARRRGVPIRSVRSNGQGQIQRVLLEIFAPEEKGGDALEIAEEAAATVLAENRPVELPPQSARLRRIQHEIADSKGLTSYSQGREPLRCVTFYPPLAGPRPE